ncbi:MAG: CoA-binding protein [Synergistaceae bacterium]|nr:CoA-binding protein [Synergistaceae bacterium]
MNKEDILKQFVCTHSKVAIVGASPKVQRPVFRVMNYLAGAGFTLFPVNPVYAGEDILDLPCLASLPDLPGEVDVVALFLSAKMQTEVAEEIRKLSFKPVVWFQPGAENDELAALLKADGYTVVESDCMMAAHMDKCH